MAHPVVLDGARPSDTALTFRSSELCGTLPRMPSDEPPAATVTDPNGHEVVLLVRIWEGKIARDHPELIDYLDAVMETVANPDHVEPDALPARSRYYRRDAGPSRWLVWQS